MHFGYVIIGLGIVLDVLSLYLGAKKNAGPGSSGIPLIPLLLYFLGLLFAPLTVSAQILLFILALVFHVFCQSIGPGLYGTYLNGRTALHRAALKGNVERIESLLHLGLDANARDKGGWTALEIATSGGKKEAAIALLGATDLAQLDSARLLVRAVGSGQTDIVSLLLDAEVPLNGERGIYWPPLHETVINKDATMAEYLLERGVDRNEKDKSGQTALELARERGFREMVSLLEARTTSAPPS